MLLRDTSAVEADSSSSSSSSAVVKRFVSAVLNTESLAKPAHVVLPRDTQAHDSLV